MGSLPQAMGSKKVKGQQGLARPTGREGQWPSMPRCRAQALENKRRDHSPSMLRCSSSSSPARTQL